MDTSFLCRTSKVLVIFLWISMIPNYQVADAAPPSLETIAKQGDAVAQYNLGDQYEGMEGTENHKIAAMWFRKSAEQGYTESQYSLGLMYLWGKGVQQDYREAEAWFRKAAEQGHIYPPH